MVLAVLPLQLPLDSDQLKLDQLPLCLVPVLM